MRWFGAPWGAAVNFTNERCDVPVGALCQSCAQPIAFDDAGFELPFLSERNGPQLVYYHRRCLLEVVGLVNQPAPDWTKR